MRYLFLIVLFLAAGCSSSKTDDAAKKAGEAAKKAGASAASAASAAAKSVASAAKKAVESKAPASAQPASAAQPAAGGDNSMLVAVWKADVEAIAKTMMNDPRMAKMPEAQRKQAMEMGKKMLANMTMEFTKDGKMIMSMGPQMKQEGTYTVKAVNGKEVTIEGTMKGKTQTLKAMIDGGTLSMEVDGQKMVFKK